MDSPDALSRLAPCGMHCGICRAYLRKRNPCPGCRGEDTRKCMTRVACKIKNCVSLRDGNRTFCFDCDTFPCALLHHLDKRYRANYRMSVIENLNEIKRTGAGAFLEQEKARWACPHCGATICVHDRACASCGHERPSCAWFSPAAKAQ